MSAIIPSVDYRDGYLVVTWANMTVNDTGAAIALTPLVADKSLIITGTFGGATFTLQGAMSTSGPWVDMIDGNAGTLAYTQPGTDMVAPCLFAYQVARTGGGGTTDVTLSLVCKSGGIRSNLTKI